MGLGLWPYIIFHIVYTKGITAALSTLGSLEVFVLWPHYYSLSAGSCQLDGSCYLRDLGQRLSFFFQFGGTKEMYKEVEGIFI